MGVQRIATTAFLCLAVGSGAVAAPPERALHREDPDAVEAAAGVTAAGCGESWRWGNPSPQGSPLGAIVYTPEHGFVATGWHGAIVTSPDGIAWTWRPSGVAGDLTGLTWGGGMFVAVGPGYGAPPTIVTSPDGINWTPRDYGQPADPRQVVWDGQRYRTAGGIGGFLTSTDGQTWLPQPTTGADYVVVNGLIWSGTQFVAVGEDDGGSLGPYGVALVSRDGVTWTKQDFPALGLSLTGVASSGSRYVAASSNGQFLVSLDGTSWLVEDRIITGGLNAVVWTGTRFLAAGMVWENPFPVATVFASLDGVAWTQFAMDARVGGYLAALAAGGGRTVVVGSPGPLVSNDDLAVWTNCQQGPQTEFRAVAWSGQRFLAVGEYGPSLTSRDGLTWSGPSEWPGGLYLDVTWDGTEFVAVGLGAAIATTTDGLVWKHPQSGTSAELSGVASNGTRIVIVGGAPYGSPDVSVILTSPDAETWTVQEIPTNGALKRVRWLGGGFVAVGDGTVLTSSDGLAWSDASAGGGIGACAGVTLTGVAWNGERYVAVGTQSYCPGWCGGSSLVSLDGISWDCTWVSPWINGLDDVIWDGSRFLAVSEGAAGVILSSPDGMNWTRNETPNSSALVGLGTNGRTTVAVGYDGTILTSECSQQPRVRRHLGRGGP